MPRKCQIFPGLCKVYEDLGTIGSCYKNVFILVLRYVTNATNVNKYPFLSLYKVLNGIAGIWNVNNFKTIIGLYWCLY